MGTTTVARAVLICSLYAVAGPSLILLNKHILSTLGFHFPLTLSCIGQLTSFLLSAVMIHGLGWVKLENRDKVSTPFYVRNIMPVGIFGALTLSCGNSVYLYLSVAFIQMLKAFTPVVTLIVAVLLRVSHPTLSAIVAVAGISAGTCVAVYGELNFSTIGFTLMLISEVAEGIRLVLMQILLKNFKFSAVEGLYYMSPATVLWMGAAILLTEVQQMGTESAWKIAAAAPWTFIGAGVLGFCVNTMSFLVIQATSSVTLKSLAVARTAGLVLFCAMFLGEVVTKVEALGYAISFACFIWYSYLEMTSPSSASAGKSAAPSMGPGTLTTTTTTTGIPVQPSEPPSPVVSDSKA